MQTIRIYRRSGGLAAAFCPLWQDEAEFSERFPEGQHFLWLR